MRSIVEDKLIKKAQGDLFRNLTSSLQYTSRTKVRALADIFEIDIYHNNSIWYGYKEIKGRHLNAFGLIGSNNQYLSTEFQLSIPISGINKRMGGIFGIDDQANECSVLYRGLISGKTGVYKSDFLCQYKGKKCTLINENIEVLLLGSVNEKNLLQTILNYIESVKHFKSLISQR